MKVLARYKEFGVENSKLSLEVVRIVGLGTRLLLVAHLEDGIRNFLVMPKDICRYTKDDSEVFVLTFYNIDYPYGLCREDAEDLKSHIPPDKQHTLH